MMSEMSWEEFREWMAYGMIIEPFGEERGDLRAGIISSAVVNCNIDPSKSKLTSPVDFMPTFGQKSSTKSKPSHLKDPDEWGEYLDGIASQLSASARTRRAQVRYRTMAPTIRPNPSDASANPIC